MTPPGAANLVFLVSLAPLTACATGDAARGGGPSLGLGGTSTSTGEDGAITTIGASVSVGDSGTMSTAAGSGVDSATSRGGGADEGTTGTGAGSGTLGTGTTGRSGTDTGTLVSGCQAYAEHKLSCDTLARAEVAAYVQACEVAVADYYDVGGQLCADAYEDALACLSTLACRAVGCDPEFAAVDTACGFA